MFAPSEWAHVNTLSSQVCKCATEQMWEKWDRELVLQADNFGFSVYWAVPESLRFRHSADTLIQSVSQWISMEDFRVLLPDILTGHTNVGRLLRGISPNTITTQPPCLYRQLLGNGWLTFMTYSDFKGMKAEALIFEWGEKKVFLWHIHNGFV